MVTFWERINIGLPNLPYAKEELSKQADESTKWASHSHCPLKVSQWDEFDACIATAAILSQQMSSVRFKTVREEEHVTHNVERIRLGVLDNKQIHKIEP